VVQSFIDVIINNIFKRLNEGLKFWNKEVFSILDLNIEQNMKDQSEVEDSYSASYLACITFNTKHILLDR
jgi:hypothetical protein